MLSRPALLQFNCRIGLRPLFSESEYAQAASTPEIRKKNRGATQSGYFLFELKRLPQYVVHLCSVQHIVNRVIISKYGEEGGGCLERIETVITCSYVFSIDIYTVHPFRNSANWIQQESTYQSQCIFPQSFKTVLMNTISKSRLRGRLFPAFLCFEYGLWKVWRIEDNEISKIQGKQLQKYKYHICTPAV